MSERRRYLTALAALWACTRLAFLTVFWASPIVPISLGDRPADFRIATTRWDAGLLLRLAEGGYRELHDAAFFPSFPLAVSAVSHVLGDTLLAALGLNALLSLTSVLLLFQLVSQSHTPREAFFAASTLLFHPLSFFLSVAYTEALFLCLVLGCFLAVASGQWAAATACAAVAGLTRNTGALLCLPLLALALRAEPGSGTERPGLRRFGLALAPLVGVGCFSLFTTWRFGQPFAFVIAQEYYRGHIALAPPFGALLHELGRWRAWVDHHLPLTLVGLWLSWRVLRFRSRSHALFVLPPLLLSLSLSKLAITPRLHLVLFPLWIEAGLLVAELPRWQRRALAVTGLLLGATLAFRFSRNLWID